MIKHRQQSITYNRVVHHYFGKNLDKIYKMKLIIIVLDKVGNNSLIL